MPTLQVKDANNDTQTIQTVPPVSRAAAALSLPTAMSTEDKAVFDATAASLVSILAKIVAAPATEAKQDALNALMTTQNGYLDGVEGSLTSILAKIIANPATEVTLAAALAELVDVTTALSGLTAAVALEVTQQLVLDELGDQTTHLATLASAAASTDPAATVFDTATMRNGTTSLTPKYASVAGTGSADLVALVASKKIRVLAYVLVFNAASTAKFQTGATTDLTGAMPFGINGGISAAFNPVGWFETTSGAKLNLVLGTSVAWAGHLVYVEV